MKLMREKKFGEKGRWTDILIKEENKWQFIGWQGGDINKLKNI